MTFDIAPSDWIPELEGINIEDGDGFDFINGKELGWAYYRVSNKTLVIFGHFPDEFKADSPDGFEYKFNGDFDTIEKAEEFVKSIPLNNVAEYLEAAGGNREF